MVFELKILNDNQFKELIDSLKVNESSKIVKAGLQSAAQIMLDAAKSNYLSSLKNSDNANISNDFKGQIMKNKVGIIVGVIDNGNGYIYRWNEWGSKPRQTGGRTRGNTFRANSAKATDKLGRAAHSTGTMPAKHYFFTAVQATTEEANEVLNESIYNQLNEIMNSNNQ